MFSIFLAYLAGRASSGASSPEDKDDFAVPWPPAEGLLECRGMTPEEAASFMAMEVRWRRVQVSFLDKITASALVLDPKARRAPAKKAAASGGGAGGVQGEGDDGDEARVEKEKEKAKPPPERESITVMVPCWPGARAGELLRRPHFDLPSPMMLKTPTKPEAALPSASAAREKAAKMTEARAAVKARGMQRGFFLTNLKPGCSVALLAKLQTALRLEDSNGGAKREVLIPVASVATVKPSDGGKWAVPRFGAAFGITGSFGISTDPIRDHLARVGSKHLPTPTGAALPFTALSFEDFVAKEGGSVAAKAVFASGIKSAKKVIAKGVGSTDGGQLGIAAEGAAEIVKKSDTDGAAVKVSSVSTLPLRLPTEIAWLDLQGIIGSALPEMAATPKDEALRAFRSAASADLPAAPAETPTGAAATTFKALLPPVAGSAPVPISPVRAATVSSISLSTGRGEWVVGTVAAVSPWLGTGSSLVAVAIPPSEPLARFGTAPTLGGGGASGVSVEDDGGEDSEDSDSDCEFEDPAANEFRAKRRRGKVDSRSGSGGFAAPALPMPWAGQAADHIRGGFRGMEQANKSRPDNEIDPIKKTTGTALESWTAALVLAFPQAAAPSVGKLGDAAANWLDVALAPVAEAINQVAKATKEAHQDARRKARAAAKAAKTAKVEESDAVVESEETQENGTLTETFKAPTELKWQKPPTELPCGFNFAAQTSTVASGFSFSGPAAPTATALEVGGATDLSVSAFSSTSIGVPFIGGLRLGQRLIFEVVAGSNGLALRNSANFTDRTDNGGGNGQGSGTSEKSMGLLYGPKSGDLIEGEVVESDKKEAESSVPTGTSGKFAISEENVFSQGVVNGTNGFLSLSAMPGFAHASPEELRLADYRLKEGGPVDPILTPRKVASSIGSSFGGGFEGQSGGPKKWLRVLVPGENKPYFVPFCGANGEPLLVRYNGGPLKVKY
jgi:hypothetical protein